MLIGGGACELLMGDVGVAFRATKDLDIVLIVEALDPASSSIPSAARSGPPVSRSERILINRRLT
ncbi:MAG TPA: hypothetical protein VHU79_00535, partial [Sphingomicrobium sp.]|nr:hypothetical protein [Sphingomicrobium sp.]